MEKMKVTELIEALNNLNEKFKEATANNEEEKKALEWIDGIIKQANEVLSSINILETALQEACEDAADSCCPHEFDLVTFKQCAECPHQGELHEDSQRDINCWKRYYLQEATKEKAEKYLYKCNEGGVAEWCVAESKKQAYDFMKNLWGESTMKEYVDEYFESDSEYDPGSNLDDFIENFFDEEDLDRNFTIADAGTNNGSVTKKVREWLEDIKTVPSYLCCEDF